uniref:Putative cytochrome P450 6a13 n=1 Tax=Lygus hesperus TaxID=30085 RepID=A0A0A9YNC8_LYGHE
MLLYIILALGLAVLLIWLLSRPFYWAGKGIKYLTPKPIVGNFGQISKGLMALNESLYNAFPEEKLYGLHVYLTPGIFIRDPDLMVDVCIKDYDHFTRNTLASNQETDITGGNMLFLHGQQWKEVRGKTSPFFTPMKIKAMLSSVDVTLPKAMKVLEDAIRIGEPCNLSEFLSQIVNDVITQAVFGMESDVYQEDSKFKPLASIFFSPKTNLMFTVKNFSRTVFKLLKLQSFDKDAALFLEGIVRDLMDYRNKNNIQGHDFVQGMMDIMEKHGNKGNGTVEYFPDGTRKPKYDFDEMFLHAFIIFLGGVESTATTMTWLFYELAKNQEVQDRCREEVMAVVDGKGRHPTLEDINELPYNTAAIKEAVRMYPPFADDVSNLH